MLKYKTRCMALARPKSASLSFTPRFKPLRGSQFLYCISVIFGIVIANLLSAIECLRHGLSKYSKKY